MSVLDRSALTESPLADLHTVASELSIDGYRRLRRPELIDAILDRQGGVESAPSDDAPAEEAAPKPRTRSRRPRKSDAADTADAAEIAAPADIADVAETGEPGTADDSAD